MCSLLILALLRALRLVKQCVRTVQAAVFQVCPGPQQQGGDKPAAGTLARKQSSCPECMLAIVTASMPLEEGTVATAREGVYLVSISFGTADFQCVLPPPAGAVAAVEQALGAGVDVRHQLGFVKCHCCLLVK